MFHRRCNTVRRVRAKMPGAKSASHMLSIAAAYLIYCGLAPAGLEAAQVDGENSVLIDWGGDNAVASSGGPPTKHLLISSFQCYLPGCDYENAVLRYNGATGAFLNVQIPTISGPYGIAVQPRRETHLVVSRPDNAVYEFHPRTGAYIRKLISAGAEGLNSPQYILVAPNGNLLVTSTQTAGNLGKFNGILEFDSNTGAFVREFVDGGSILFVDCADPFCLQGPNAMAFGPNGRLYVTSEVNHSVIEYNGTTGAYVGHFLNAARLISPIGLTIRPAGIIRDGNVVVTSIYPTANTFDDRILEFDKTSRALVSTAEGGFVGSVIRPGPITWAADGNLLVAEHTGTLAATNFADRITKFHRDTGASQGVFTAGDSNSHFITAMFQTASNYANGDYDMDGDVDLIDIAAFQRCSGLSPSTACKNAFDDNLSGHIGDEDFVAFFQKVRGPRHTCVNNAGCNDGNPCTSDTCIAGECVYSKVANGTPCPDSLFCNGAETCLAGFCAPAPPCVDQAHCDEVNNRCLSCITNAECNDGNTCTTDTCVIGTGCQNQNNTNTCNDGNACTTADRCAGGFCVGGPPPTCNDGNVCTNDVCDTALGCIFIHNLAPCSDGNNCTLEDFCLQGTCRAGQPRNCADTNPCTTDSCDQVLGCRNLNNTFPCNDNNACTTSDTCAAGVCRGTPMTCNDNVPCTDDSCAGGVCVHTPRDYNCDNGLFCDGAETCDPVLDCRPGTVPNCDDGRACTVDTCNQKLGCIHTPNHAACNDGNNCTTDSCNVATGCVFANNSNSCNDGNACTTGDTCVGGTCTGGAPLVCNDGNVCTTDGCNPATGCTQTNNSAPCSDGNACTQADICQGGTCTSGSPIVCTPLDQCHNTGTCNPATGVCSNPEKPNGTTCNDSNACTQTDTCQTGVCTGASPVNCTALDQCHNAGTCNPANGVCSNPEKPNGTSCNDSNACTQTDTCQTGVCTGASPVVCTALDQCHDVGTCNPATGLCSNPNSAQGTPCDDDDACTQTDACQDGSCVGVNPVVCTPLDQCHVAGVCNQATGVCTDPNATDGAPCGDSSECTQTDTCQSGVCVGGNDVVCAPSDQCHVAGVCDPLTGLCSDPEAPNGTTCDDGDACTQTDSCQSGVCTGSNSVVCTPSDQCHVAGVCDPLKGVCSDPEAPEETPCDDGDACTQIDTCQSGMCIGANDVVCTASDDCHDVGVCDPETGVCSDPPKADGSPCDDGDECTLIDTCQSGVCTAGSDVVCTASDNCHDVGVCDPETGVCSNPPRADGSACDDGDECTLTDTCQGGVCTGTSPVVCTASDQCHDAGVCDSETGVCTDPPKTDGTTCDDGNECTLIDTCQSGVCTAGSDVVCTASDNCHDVGVCDPETGVCSDPPKADGSPCDDGDECTLADICQGGVCTGGSDVVCTASDNCHDVGVCDPETGVCSDPPKADGTACDDGDECTLTDTCQGGACTGGGDVVCTALDQCHDVGVCDPETGVCTDPPKADGTACDDGDQCTLTDTCQDGVCTGGGDVVCTALDQCHDVGVCDPETGVCSNPTLPNGATCEDGDFCTEGSTCSGGVCGGGSPVDCNDSNFCTDDSCNPASGCVNVNNTLICDDSLFCTVNDTCVDGTCTGDARDCPNGCDEENDVCNPP